MGRTSNFGNGDSGARELAERPSCTQVPPLRDGKLKWFCGQLFGTSLVIATARPQFIRADHQTVAEGHPWPQLRLSPWGEKKTPEFRRGLKLVAEVGFEPTVPPCGIMSLDGKKPAGIPAGLKLVAGVGFEPTAFRL